MFNGLLQSLPVPFRRAKITVFRGATAFAKALMSAKLLP
jgi:hypothetical protein